MYILGMTLSWRQIILQWPQEERVFTCMITMVIDTLTAQAVCGVLISDTVEPRLQTRIADQAKRLPYCSPWYYTNEPAAELAKQIAHRTPGDLNNVFFTTCGSTAIDSALRFVQFYFNFLDKPQKKTIIARDKGYHGSTYLATSVSGKERDKRKLDTISNNISFLSDVNPNLRDENETIDEWCENKVNELENRILELGAETIAAFVAEPILASGGVIIPPNGYHKKTKQICEKYDILYISDEVVTGLADLGIGLHLRQFLI